jgi:serine/threonine-protein kinase
VVTDATTLDRFRREARTPARIDSDHVVRVTDADVAPELGGVPFLVMEYLRGEDLEHLAARRGALPPSDVVTLLAQAARALDKAHALGIVHRDLKPENLFVTQREDGTPHVKILDFGIAKMTGGDVKEAGRLTATGQIFGTPLYMSPEQAMAESEKICPQTDVWALGLIAHRLLHGKDFWTATTLTHLVAQIAFEPIPAPSARGSTLGPAYDEWFAKCCCRPIEGRFKGAGEAVSALAAALRVTDSPSQLARLPMSVRIPTGDQLEERDMLAATSAPEALTGTPASAMTGPSSPPTTALGRTQFGAEAAKPGRVPRTLGFVIGGALAVIAGGIAAWKITSPSAGAGGGGPAQTSGAAAEPTRPREPAEPTPTIRPVVVPSAEVTAAAEEPGGPVVGATTATTVKGAGPAVKGTTAVPTTKATAAPTTAPVVTPAVTTAAPAVTVDPLGSRR